MSLKKLFFILVVGFGFLIQSTFASVTAKAGTWQMTGYRMDVNLSKVTDLSADKFSIIWYFDGGSWKAFSKDTATVKAIKKLGLYGDSLKDNQGFWVKARKDFNILPYTPKASFLPATKGWHLLSLYGGSVDSKHLPANIGIVYFYRNGVWDYIKKLSNNDIQNSKNYLTNYLNEGFWIYNNNNGDNHLIYGGYSYKNDDTFSNKTFKFDGKSITLDQNGSVVSNISEINGGKWKGFHYADYGIGFGVKKGDKKYFYNASVAYNQILGYYLRYYKLSSVNINTFKTLSNGIEETLDANSTNFYDKNITVDITDYNRSKVLDTSVKTALDTLTHIADFGDTNARGKLDDIKTSLLNSTSKDAKVVLALVNFIEILDTDIVKNSFNADTQILDINSFVNSIMPDENTDIRLAESLTDYEGNAKVLIQDLSDRLKTNADNLKNLELDENYYFKSGNVKLNFVDIKELRMAMLALSFKLQFIASYQLGNDAWLKPVTENIDNMSIEYTKAATDPVAFLNSGVFLVKPDGTKLLKAKSLFREFLGLYYDFLNSDNYAREGMNIPGRNLDTVNLKRHIKLAIDNLDGKSDNVNILTDNINWGEYDNQTQTQAVTHKYFKRVFDLNALFNATKAITIADFGTFSYDGVYDSKISKLNNTPSSSDGTELENNIKSTQLFSTPNHINNFFKSYKNGDIEYTGSSLLNEIFGTN